MKIFFMCKVLTIKALADASILLQKFFLNMHKKSLIFVISNEVSHG